MRDASALVTGSSQRIGKAIAQHLHAEGYDLILHCNNSLKACQQVCDEMNALRPGSASIFQADLSTTQGIEQLARHCLDQHQNLALIVNNASPFFDDDHPQAFEQYLSIAAMPFNLAMKLKSLLKQNHGQIISLLDIYTQKPKRHFYHYSAAKAAAQNYLKATVMELAPQARANGIAPGAILWPENEDASNSENQEILSSIPLARSGSTDDIVKTLHFLLQCDYINAQVIAVDGGRSINL